ncbi:MAG: hypothetical protein K0Q72_1284 [Armatimonadetes bacterium]|jgi:hypothetical protein|nr:hypothetical protein [Armatimonadota bacterium]
MRSIHSLLLLATAIGAAVAAGAAEAPNPVLKAGAAAVKITPSLTRPVYIAGYENNRIATGVRDDLWARVLVLDDGKTRMATVALDLVGVSNQRVNRIRARIRSVPSANVLVACTHVHSGPDSLGLWGPNFATTGIDPLYMTRLEDRIVAAVDAAAGALQPVEVFAGATEVPDGLVHNSREPLQDKQLTALRFAGSDGTTVATVINYGGHPEVNKSKSITSDYVHYVREAAEKRFGGVALFLNGALGGMVTPKVSANSFEEMQRVGEGVGKAAVTALERAERVDVAAVALHRRELTLPLDNSGFQILAAGKVLDTAPVGGRVPTEVWRVDLGPVTWVTIPGEILPKPALALKAKMPGKYRMIVALGNDELGYILDPADFDLKRYSYEKSMSVGKQTWPLLFEAAQELLR